MEMIEQLYSGFYLSKESCNSQISDWLKSLWVAPIKNVNKYEKLEIDYEHFAFAEKGEYFHGLENFLWINGLNHSPIFIFDNHNHAPIFRYYVLKNFESDSPILIHIDQHSDCWDNQNHLELNRNEYELQKVFYFWNEKCNVGNFIPPSLGSWIISEQIQIRSINSLQNLKINDNQNYILDIDLDFCLNWINRNKIDYESVKILKEKFDKIWEFALCTTIATSPYFLNQDLAIKIIEILFDE